MTEKMPRIKAVAVLSPTELKVMWRGGGADTIDLAGWIATGGAILAPLKDAETFARAKTTNYGAAVGWGDDDLAIDAVHLELLAREQRPFTANELTSAQATLGLSNQEAADFLQVSLSTWNNYKAGGAEVPAVVAMVLRAARRDPILMQAHYRPRKAGRPPAGGRRASSR